MDGHQPSASPPGAASAVGDGPRLAELDPAGSDALFARLLEASPTGVVIVNRAGHILLANPALSRQFGYSSGELLGKALDLLLPARVRARHVEHRESYVAAPSVRAMGRNRDLTGLHKDGTEFPVEVGLSSVQWRSQTLVLATVMDITARKRLEITLRQANNDLEEFTYVASHDLKSPLRGIAELVDWIGEDLDEHPNPAVLRNLERVKLRVTRMEGIISDLLSYARAGRVQMEATEIDLRELIGSILELEPRPPGFNVEVEVQGTGALKAVRTPLETVLRNLISNAIKHHDRDTGTIRVRVNEEEEHCVFSIEDDGPGIPEGAHDRVFKLFQTVSAVERMGSGIGLAVTKRLTECHGGRVSLTPSPVRGATFHVRWPRFARKDLDD